MSENLIFSDTLPDAFAAAGMPFPGMPEAGGMLRFSTSPKHPGDRAGWMRLFPDGNGAVFGDWRNGQDFTWQRKNGHEPTPAERQAWKAQADTLRRAALAEREADYSTAASQARTIWQAAKPLPADFAYLAKKGIRPHIARLSHDGRLMVPVHGPDGEIQSLQFIGADGSKRFHPGGKMAAGWCLLGTVRADEPILIAEGFATAATLHQDTGKPVFCCFSASNLLPVAQMLKARYSAAVRVICGDDDKHTEGNPGRTKATAAAEQTGALVLFPACEGSDFNDLAQEAGPDAVRQVVEGALNEPASLRFKLLSDGDLLNLPPIQWRIKHVLPDTGLAAVFGASGSGKSFLVLDMLQSLAAGADWFGHRATPCPVIYCALEGEGGIAGRVNAYRARHGATADDIRYLVQSFNLLEADDIRDLAQAIKAGGNGAGVVVLDTLNRAAPGADENDSKSMGQIIAAAKELQSLIGGLVLLVHHTGKDASKGLRGHSSLHAALDAAIEVRRDGDNREWLIAKSKDGEDGSSHPFSLEVVELGIDEDGEPITSCTIRQVESFAANVRRVLPPKSGNQKVVWDALGEVFRKAGLNKPEGAPASLPLGRPCITLEHAIEQTRARLVCEPKRQTERCQAAIRGLVERGLMHHEVGFLWCK